MSGFRFAVLLLGLSGVGVARAAVDCTAREPLLPHVCASGPNTGLACTPDLTGIADPLTCSVSRPAQNDACLGAKCTLALSKTGKFSGTMTIIVDENVSQFDDGQSIQNAVAATVVLDLGDDRLLAQTYQNLGSTLDDLASAPSDTFGVQLSEQRLRNEADLRDDKPRIVNDILYRAQDDELAGALRTLFAATGKPVITKVSSVVLSDHPDGLGTVLRFKIKGGFVQP